MSFQPTSTPDWFSSTDNSQTAYALASEAAGMDHFRQLETANMAHQAGMVGYWKLDEAGGTTSADNSLSGLNGTWVNGPSYTSDQPANIGLTDFGSLTFNGINQYVEIPISPMLPVGNAPRTICGWGKASSATGGWHWIAAYGSPHQSQAMFIGRTGTSLYAGAYGDDLPPVPNFWDNKWHFIALTYDGTTANLYADGVLKISALKNWILVPGLLRIGQQIATDPGYWDGSIDDVRIYNQALSAADIAGIAGVTIPYAGTPYGGTPWPIPGKIEAENYDNGGKNVAYFDTTPGNTGGADTRNDDVDIRWTGDAGGGYQVGWTDTGEWLNYTIQAAATGFYTLQVRTASGLAGAVHFELDGVYVTGVIAIPNTGGWDTFTTLSVPYIPITAGRHVLRVYYDAGGPDLNWFNIIPTPPGTLITGKEFDDGAGPWGGNMANVGTAAFDGNVNSFYDCANPTGYVGIDTGTATTVSRIVFAPRVDVEFRMGGGVFEGSNTSSTTGYVTIGAVTGPPTDGLTNTLTVTDPTPYRWLRYRDSQGGYCNVAEIQFVH